MTVGPAEPASQMLATAARMVGTSRAPMASAQLTIAEAKRVCRRQVAAGLFDTVQTPPLRRRSEGVTVTDVLIERHPVVDGCLCLTVAGDFDMASAARVEAAIQGAIADPNVTAVVLDIAKVAFLDSIGISVLLRGRQLAAEHDITFRVTNPEGVVRAVLEITGVLTMLTDKA